MYSVCVCGMVWFKAAMRMSELRFYLNFEIDKPKIHTHIEHTTATAKKNKRYKESVVRNTPMRTFVHDNEIKTFALPSRNEKSKNFRVRCAVDAADAFLLQISIRNSYGCCFLFHFCSQQLVTLELLRTHSHKYILTQKTLLSKWASNGKGI